MLYRPRNPEVLEQRKGLPGLSETLSRLLAIRGIVEPDAAARFLHPAWEQLHDPYRMPDMRAAVERIRAAARDAERVVIYGDYDVDGVTSTALLVLALRRIGIQPGYFIPDRHQEGYGLHEETVTALAEQGYTLMITVDCGVTAVEEIALSRSLGMDTIVTDHHQPQPQLPESPVLCPKLGGYPYPDLAGVGVAAKLVQALGGSEWLQEYADIIAFGTVADIVPLLEENRVFVRLGLDKMDKGPLRPGIQALLDVSGAAGKPVTATTISYLLAPRVNAGGRIGHSARSVELFTTRDEGEAREIALKLNEQNVERQRQESLILEDALRQVREGFRPGQDRVLLAVGEGWNPGVIGIVASRLVERYACPAILLSSDGEVCTGSGRSIRGVHLMDALRTVEDLFLRYGGHSMAAGLTMPLQNVAQLRKRLQAHLEGLPDERWVPALEYDLPVTLEKLDEGLLEDIERLQPTGMGNPQPMFLIEGVEAAHARLMGAQQQHLKLLLGQGEIQIEGVAFRMADRLPAASGRLDVLAVPEWNTWMGARSVRLLVRSLRQSRDAGVAVAVRQGDPMFVAHLASLLKESRPKPAFRHYIRLPAQHSAEEMARRLLGGGEKLLIACAAPETFLRWHGWLAQNGLGDRVRACAFALPSGEPEATLWCPARLGDPAVAGFAQILLADGVWDEGWAAALAEEAPRAAVYAAPIPEDGRLRAADSLLPLDAMRELYKRIHQRRVPLSAARDFEAFFAELNDPAIGRPAALAGLCAMRDIGVAEFCAEPFRFRLVPSQGRRNIDESWSRELLRRIAGPEQAASP